MKSFAITHVHQGCVRTSNDETNIFYSNVRSLSKNISHFRVRCSGKNHDMIMFTETRIVQQKNSYEMNGYKMINCPSHNAHTGGCAIYVRNNLKFEVICNYNEKSTWFLGICLNKKDFYGVIYRGHTGSNLPTYFESFHKFHKDFVSLWENVLILSDIYFIKDCDMKV